MCKSSFWVVIILVALLGGYAAIANAQNSLFFNMGVNHAIPNNSGKGDFFGKTNGKFGFNGGIGFERTIGKNSFSLELSYVHQNFGISIGPLFFPDDPPTSIGSFYNLNYHIQTVNIMPSFNYSILKGKLGIPIGIGIQKNFPSFNSELVKPDHSATNHFVEFYHIPDFNISTYSGLNFTFFSTKKIAFFSSLRYSYNLFPVKSLYQDFKKINTSMLSISLGIKI